MSFRAARNEPSGKTAMSVQAPTPTFAKKAVSLEPEGRTRIGRLRRDRSEDQSMTAPVAQAPGAAGTWVVRFTMPSQWTLQTLPVPDNPAVTLRNTEPARFAVLRFSGLAKPDDVRERSAELLDWAKARKLRVAGPVSLAQYNPPWTLWFMRRNEVMVEVAR